MRIAYLTNRFLPDSVGGGETHTHHLAASMVSRGHMVEIWRTYSANEAVAPYVYQDLQVVPAPNDFQTGNPELSRFWLRNRTRRFPVDIVHATISGKSQKLLTACISEGIPTVITLLDYHFWCPRALLRPGGARCSGPESIDSCHNCILSDYGKLHHLRPFWKALPASFRGFLHGLPFASRLEPLGRYYRELESMCDFFQNVLARNSFFIAPSPIMRRIAEENHVPPEMIAMIPYGIPDALVFNRQQKSLSPVLRIGYLGRLEPNKGLHILIQAVRSLPPRIKCQLSIYGVKNDIDSSYIRTLEEATRADSRFVFHPPVPQCDLPAVHRILDLVVIPSLWHENATIVLLESLALGTPVIVSNVEGMAPFIDDLVTGYLVPPGDPAALAAKLTWCHANREALLSMANRCRPVLTMKAQAERIEAIYQHLAMRPVIA